MNFGEYFRALCCTFGAEELSLVSGQMPTVIATKIGKIMKRLILDDICADFFQKVDSLDCELECFDNSIKGIQKLTKLEDPTGCIKKIISKLNNPFYDVAQIERILLPYYLFSEEYRKRNIFKTLEILEKECIERDIFLGFFCFFDLSNYLVKIITAKNLKKTKKYIERSEKRFCLANLDASHLGQDINIAEGFCKSFNTMLRRNNLREFMILRDT